MKRPPTRQNIEPRDDNIEKVETYTYSKVAFDAYKRHIRMMFR